MSDPHFCEKENIISLLSAEFAQRVKMVKFFDEIQFFTAYAPSTVACQNKTCPNDSKCIEIDGEAVCMCQWPYVDQEGADNTTVSCTSKSLSIFGTMSIYPSALSLMLKCISAMLLTTMENCTIQNSVFFLCVFFFFRENPM